MNSHNLHSGPNGQFQYPPFNSSTASYTLAGAQISIADFASPSPTSPVLTCHLDPEHDANGIGGMNNLTLEQYMAGQRASIAPPAPLATVSNKRPLSHDQVCSFSS
jgi:hypothetical protein